MFYFFPIFNVSPMYLFHRSDLNLGDEILDSLAPFIVFRGHEVQVGHGGKKFLSLINFPNLFLNLQWFSAFLSPCNS